MAILAATAFQAAWRSRSFAAGIVVTVIMCEIAAVISVIGVTALLALRHDAATLQAAADSGGLEEAYILPFMAVIPALIVGGVGSIVGRIGAAITVGAKVSK